MDVGPPALKKASVTTLCRARPCLNGDDTDVIAGSRTVQLGWRLWVLAAGVQNERLCIRHVTMLLICCFCVVNQSIDV